MQTAKVRRLLIGMAITATAMLGGIALAPVAMAECNSSSVGCSRVGGVPTYQGYCTGGYNGDCYECIYTCTTGGTDECAEQADGSNQSCRYHPDQQNYGP